MVLAGGKSGKAQRHRANISKDQVEGGIYPMCEFCHERFFGNDEFYAHCRERRRLLRLQEERYTKSIFL